MHKTEIQNEYYSIIRESHPGLTYEEFRDCSLFLIYYQYLCIRYPERIPKNRDIHAMVVTAMKGKLQIASFVRCISEVSFALSDVYGNFTLKGMSLILKIGEAMPVEKQKSFARYIRKIIKKIDSFTENPLMLEMLPGIFEELLRGFSNNRKETYISPVIEELLRLSYDRINVDPKRIFVPSFRNGILVGDILGNGNAEIYGYENNKVYIEYFYILSHMRGIPEEKLRIYARENWDTHLNFLGMFDRINVFMPEGVPAGTLLSDMVTSDVMENLAATTKGEFPFILSAIPLLSETGSMTAVMPSAMLYREGRETLARKHLVKELNCLEALILLPENVLNYTGQSEVLLVFDSYREREDIMFFDLSELETFNEDSLEMIRDIWSERKTVPGLSASVPHSFIEENEYNLNFPRYISRSFKKVELDAKEKRKRIEMIDKEISEINALMDMHMRALEMSGNEE